MLWIAWQRDDPAGEVFFSTSDLLIEGVGTSYCPAAPNSVDPDGAQFSASGSASVGANDLVLHAGPVPVGQNGIFFHGSAQANQPLGDGFLCVGGSLVRVTPPVTADATGTLTVALDNASAGGTGIAAGVTRHFQAWYRDPAGGPSGFNLSNGYSITFVP